MSNKGLGSLAQTVKENFQKTMAERVATVQQPGTGTGSAPKQQTAYQQNLQQPIQLPQQPETLRSTLGKIKARSGQDREGAANAYRIVLNQSQNRSSRFYNPYSTPTNQAIGQMADLFGQDIGEINDDWFSANAGLKDYFKISTTTNNATSPGKKGTKEQWAGYYYNQLWAAEENTKKAETELTALQEEFNYWTSRTDRNYSDQEIIDRIDWSKYKTLEKMNESRLAGTPMELNRAVNWCGEDSMYGMLWAARNGGGTGNAYLDMANSYNGVGNVWKENQEISAKLDPESPEFSPYSVGSTNLDDAAVYFGVPSFGQNWLNEHKNLAWSTDETEQKMYRTVFDAEKTTLAAEGEKAELDAWLDDILLTAKDADKVLKQLDKRLDKWTTLSKMDESIGKDGQAGSGKLLAMTRGVDYRYADVKKQIEEACARNAARADGDRTVESFNVTEAPKSTEFVMPEKETAEESLEVPNGGTAGIEARNSGVRKEATEILMREEMVKGERGLAKGEPGIVKLPYLSTGEPQMEDLVERPTPEGEAKLREAYDGKYGEGAYDKALTAEAGQAEADSAMSQLPAAPALPTVDQGQKQSEATANGKVTDAMYALDGSMSPAEKKYIKAAPGVEYERTRQNMLQGPLNPKLWQDKDFAEKLFTKSTVAAQDKYISTALGSLKVRHDFENLQKQEQATQAEIDKLYQQYGDGIYANEEIPEDISFELIPGSGQTMEIWLNPETGKYEAAAELDYNWYLMNTPISAQERLDQASYESAIQDAIDRANSYADMVRRAKEKYPEGVPEGTRERLEELERIQASTREAILAGQADYEQATADLNAAKNKYVRATEAKLRAGFDADDPETLDVALNFVGTLVDNEVPGALTATTADQLRVEFVRALDLDGQSGADRFIAGLPKDIAELDESIKDIEASLSMFPNMPEENRQAAQAWLDYFTQQKRQYEYFQFSRDENFSRYADSGMRLTARRQDDPIPMEAYLAMTDFEKNMFYAIAGRDGLEAADKYYQDIEESLLVRTQANIQANAEELAESGWLGRLANVGAGIAMSPLEVMYSAADLIGTAAGNRNAWRQLPGNISKTTFAATISEVENVYGDGAKGKVVKGAYEILFNRGRSAAVAAVFGPLFPEGTSEIVQAMPIGLTAMDDAVQSALDSGMEPWKAWTIGAITFASETVTEGIELGNIKKAFHVGEKLSRSAFKEWALSYIPNALPEVIGESLNDVAEKLADIYIGGDQGEFAKQIDAYMASGYSQEEAESMAAQDALSDVMHTALISFFSPGADLLAIGAGQLKTYSQYAAMAREQRSLTGNKVTFRDIRRGEAQKLKAYDEYQKIREEADLNRELKPLFSEAQKQNAPSILAAEETQQAQAEQYDIEMTVLDGVQDSDPTTTTATVAAVLETGDTNRNRASAAAANLGDVLGDSAVDTLQNLLAGGAAEGVDINLLKLGIQYAALGNGKAREVLQGDTFQKQDPGIQARWLASAVAEDATNQAVQQEVAAATHEFRVAEAEKNLQASGAADAAVAAQDKATDAAKETARARKKSEAADGEAQAKNEAMLAATNEAIENPTDEATNAADQARREWEHAEKVAESEAAAVPAAEERQQKAEEEARKITDDTMARIRQEAEAQVQQEEVAEANAAAEVAARQQAEAEAQAAAQAEEDVRSGKAWEARRDEVVEEILNNEYLEEGEQREARRAELVNRANQIRAGRIDMAGIMNNSEGYLAVSMLGRNLGLNVKLTDDPKLLPAGARGKYQNGTVYLNANLIKQGGMTNGQAVLEVALHEFTHSMEQTRNYKSYRDTVLQSLFGDGATANTDQLYEANARFRAAIDQKVSDYAKSVKQELSREDAEKEIIADFARTRLNDRNVVMRFLDKGLGGKIRNTLHNINQAIKNFRLTGEEKVTAEYLRRAERTFQKMINEEMRSSVHPEGGQFSIAQVAQATGMTFDEKTLTLQDADGNVIDGVKNKITADMIGQTPVGLLIDHGLTGKQNADAKEMMAGLMNMVARYKDSNLVWEIGASTLSSTFSALKSNSDPQYATTVDFGTVCAKTQAIIDVMSQVMLDRVKAGKSGGLTREEIMKVYNETHHAGLSVPCPVCYVFSRWMGVPSLLGQMSQYQHDYVVQNADGTIDRAATQAKADEYIRNAEEKYGDAKAINNAKAKLQGRLAKLEERLQQAKSKEERESIIHEMTEVDAQIGEVSAYNWVTQALCKKEKGSGKFVVDPKFKATPDEILFDLNRTSEFAEYEKNWRYRNTRGAGMGKAILPYSGETIGDVLYGVKASGRQNAIKNPWLTMDDKAAARQLANARTRARKQNLVGGQRLQSTSDFRPEWGLDYIMSFLELQAAGSKTQMYTKVAEAVDFFASVGADVNLSIMGAGQGWHEDENGNKVLDFSSVTGMDYETAKALKNKHDNVQMILVGMNDTHIRLAMANEDIDFIIPWHSSGNNQKTLKKLIGSVGEKLLKGTDYTTTQTDMVKGTVIKYKNEDGETVEYSAPGKRTAEQKLLWDARVKLLTKGGNALTLEERTALLSNPFTADLYRRFTEKGVDPDCYGVKLNGAQARQIFPYEYWDTTSTKKNADINGKRFVDYCEAMGIVPRFSQFKDDPGYWKLLIDRPMYNNDGSYHQQQVIDVTNARIGALDEGGKLTDSDLPTQAQAKYASKDPRSEHYEEYTEKERQAIENAKAALDAQPQYDDGSDGQYSVYGNDATADLEMLSDTEADYQSAVARGDMQAAAEDVESYAASKGYTLKVFHGTGEYFNEFRRGYEGIHLGDQNQASQVADMRYNVRSMNTGYRWGDVRNNIPTMTPEQRESLVRSMYLEQDYFDDGKSAPEFDGDINNWKEVARYARDIMNREAEATGTKPENIRFRMRTFDREVGSHVMSLYAKINNPVIIENDIGNWSTSEIARVLLAKADGSGTFTTSSYEDISIAGGSEITLTAEQRAELERIQADVNGDNDEKWDALSDVLGEQGFDGIQYLNTYEGDKNSYSHIALKQSDVKLADPVTYDDQGNVIPLSERFTDSTDIRYSDGGASLTDLELALAEENIKNANEDPEARGLSVQINDASESLAQLEPIKSVSSALDLSKYEGTAKNKRAMVKRWAQDMADSFGRTITRDGFGSIELNNKAISRIFSYLGYNNDAAIAAFAALPEVVRNGIEIHSNPNHKGRDVETFTFAAPIKIDGVRGNMGVIVRKSRFGNKFKTYKVLSPDGRVFVIDNQKTELALQPGSEEADRTDSVANMRLAHNSETVNGQFSAGGTSLADLDNQLVENGAITQEDLDAYNAVSNPVPPTGLSTNVMPEDNGPGRRQFGTQTAQESGALDQEVKDYLYTHSAYTPESNQEQIDRAMDWVQRGATAADPDGYRAAVDEVSSDGFDYRSADGQARMLTVMGMAALKGDIGTEMRLADAYNRQGTDLGRALQARKIFRLMTPVGRISYFQRQVDNVNRDIGKQTGKNGTIHLDEWTVRAIGAAETEEDFQKVRKAVAREIGEKIPANWKEKLRSWRMLAMLGNPRTHIRNIIGNAMFIPAVSLKNKLGAVAELGMQQGSRTKTLNPVLQKEIRDFARQDAEATKATLTGEAKYNEETLIEREKKQFRGVMQALSDFNSNALEAEDWFFLKGHYRRALGGWMQANGYTAAQMRSDPGLLEQGRAYAIKEAQKATYRDFNGLAQRLNQLTRDPKTTGQKVLAFGVEAVLPFKKTPANILKRGLEYSPVGIARSLTTDLLHLKQYNDFQNGKLDTLPDTAISPNEWIDRLCSGLTGSAIMAVGAILGNMGVVTCGLDDDDDEFEKLKGNQEYAIKFSIGGNDYTFTLDWAAPMCMPFFVGAAIQEQAASQEGFDIDELVNAFGNITEPVFNLSMLDGVNSLLDMFVSGDDTNATITQLGAKVASNYVTSYIPSILGATARTIDTTRRKSFVPSGQGTGILGTFRYAREQVENKIPGLSQTNIPYRDVWGNAETSGLGERILENFVLPGYFNQYKDDPIVNELARLGKAPKEPAKTFTAKNEKYVLTAEQWDAYKTERGQTAYNLLGELMGTAEYQTADDDGKAKLIDAVWEQANNRGKVAAIPELQIEGADDPDPLQTILDAAAKKATGDRTKANKANLKTALTSGDLEDAAAMVEALREDGVADDKIRDEIRDAYRDEYKAAYLNDDYVRMDEIEEAMRSLGLEDLDKKRTILDSWASAADKAAAEGPAVTRSMPFINDSEAYGGSPAAYMEHLMELDENGELDQVGVLDFFETVNSMTGDKPWSLLSDAVENYVDFVDPNLETSVAEMMDWLYENGYTENDIFKQHKRRPDGTKPKSRQKRVVNEGKGVQKGDAVPNQAVVNSLQGSFDNMNQLADGSFLNSSAEIDAEPEPFQQTFNGDLSSVPSYDSSWLPYYKYGSNEPIWDEDAPEEAKEGL